MEKFSAFRVCLEVLSVEIRIEHRQGSRDWYTGEVKPLRWAIWSADES